METQTSPRPVWVRPDRIEEFFGFKDRVLERILERNDPFQNVHLLKTARRKMSHRLVVWNVDLIDEWLKSLT